MSMLLRNLPALRLSFCAGLALLVAGASSSSSAQTENVLYNFQGTGDGANPTSTLVADGQGNLYGTTLYNGLSSCLGACGVVFQLSPPASQGGSWTETVLHTFGPDAPNGNLILDKNGNLYGTTETGGPLICGGGFLGCGTVFELSPPASPGAPWTESILYRFQGGTRDGYYPWGGVILDSNGNLYGTTFYGGSASCGGYPGSCGVVFELSPPANAGASWSEKIIHNFDAYDGSVPGASLIMANGVLYGTTRSGGNLCYWYDAYSGCGGVFKLIPPTGSGTEWTEHFYSPSPQNRNGVETRGAFVYAGLVQGPNGKLYGATRNGGTGQCVDLSGFMVGCGVVFEVTPPAAGSNNWNPVVLHNFTGMHDGAMPLSTLSIDKSGNLYGTTSVGGMTSSACLSVQDNFQENGCGGAIFQLKPPASGTGLWTEKTLYLFPGGNSGELPYGGIIPDGKGGFYGTTYLGGSGVCNGFGCGTVFELTP
jgi:hypothetical protein